MQPTQQNELWNRIRDFAIDDPVASVKYSDKLAHTNAWSKEYTARVIEEYRRFIFLCYVLPQGASPSKPVDEAWHLHLTYTRNYWKELCEGVLGKEIHHFPSKGGPDENEKHVQWYDDTLNAYREIFGTEAPADIWIQEARPATKTRNNDTVLSDYKKWYKKYLFVFFLPFILSLFLYGKIIIYNLTGPQFLVFYGSLVVTTIVYLLLIRSKKKKEVIALMSEKYDNDANLYQLARFIYGREKSLRAAIVDLTGRKILEPIRRGQFVYHSSNYTHSYADDNPLALHLLRNVKDGEVLYFSSLTTYYDDWATYHAGLSNLYQSVSTKDRQPLTVASLIGLIGISRCLQGYDNHKPIAFLVAMMCLSALIFLVVIQTSSGKNILQQVFRDNFKNGGQAAFQSTALASTFVFLGLGYISLMDGYWELENTFSKYGNNNGGTSSGGCGSSGCGGSGCGGGGCGGGCGGCGGGD